MMIKFATLAMMAIFYIAYFAKQITQRRQGVSTMILGKGDKPEDQKRLELARRYSEEEGDFARDERHLPHQPQSGIRGLRSHVLRYPLAFPNAWHAAAVAITLVLFHKQILGEEQFLEDAFGEEYIAYKKRVRRYL